MALDIVSRIIEITYRNCQVVAASQLSNLACVSEGCSHDNSLIVILLVVVENSLDRSHPGIFFLAVCLSGMRLVPIQDTANKRRDQECTSLSTGNCLNLREHEGQIAVNLVISLQDTGGLDTFPCGCNLDQDAGLIDANGFV